MRKNLLAVITILVFGIAPAIAKKPSFYIVSSSKSDKPADSRYASSEAAGAANQLGIYVGIALQDKYPCASTSRDADIATVLGHERDRALLGADISSDELKEIAGTIGADYVVRTQVTQIGGKFSATIAAINTRTGKIFARDSQVIPLEGDPLGALENLAKRFAQNFTGPKCPGNYTGTVTVVSGQSNSGKNPSGKPYSGNNSLRLVCRLEGTGSNATCNVNYNATMSGSGGDFFQQAAGEAPGNISVAVSGDKVRIHISMVKIKGKNGGSMPGGSGESAVDLDFGPWDAEGGVSGHPESPSGSWSDGNGTTITWNPSGS